MGDTANELHLCGLDDKQSIVLFERIYNEPVTDREDKIAKDITVTAFMIALRSRDSRTIRRSGVLERPYTQVDLKNWTDEDLRNIYVPLSKKLREKEDPDNTAFNGPMDDRGRMYRSFKDSETVQEANKRTTLEIIRLTAVYAIDAETARRDNIRSAWKAAGNVTMTGLSVAAQIAMMLAGFLI